MKVLEKPLHLVLILLFVIYIIFPISTPNVLVPWVDSPVGLVALFVSVIALFVYTNYVVGILFVFVVYELLRRNHFVIPVNNVAVETHYMPNRIPNPIPASQKEKDMELKLMNPPRERSLEEEYVEKMAPIGKSDPMEYISSGFQPLAQEHGGATF